MERGMKVGDLIKKLEMFKRDRTVVFSTDPEDYMKPIYLIEHGSKFKKIAASSINSEEIVIPITEFEY